MTTDYVHHPLNQQVNAIGGYYVLVREARLPFDKLRMRPFEGREVLYLVGHAAFDACCGVGGCAYGLVPGFVLRWQYKTDADGLPVSLVEPICSQAVQRELAHAIKKQETVQQVVFS